MKRSIMLVLIALGVIGVASAAYLVLVQSGFTANVVSSPEALMFDVSFSDIDLDTTNSSDSDSTTATISNDNGEVEMLVDIAINKTLLDAGCPDFENDTSVVIDIAGTPVNDGDFINISAGDTVFTATVDAVNRACPVAVDTVLSLAEI